MTPFARYFIPLFDQTAITSEKFGKFRPIVRHSSSRSVNGRSETYFLPRSMFWGVLIGGMAC